MSASTLYGSAIRRSPIAGRLATMAPMRGTIAIIALVAALPVAADEAQERERLATLLAASVAARALVSTAVDECTARFAELVDPALDAKMEWEARNAPFEARSRSLAAAIEARLAANSSYAGYQALRQSLLASAEAQTAGQVRETVARSLEAKPAAERIAVCRDLVKSVHEGKMDFAITQPNAYRILENTK